MLKNRSAENSCVILAVTRGSSAHQLNGLLSMGRASTHAGDAEVCRHHRTLLNSWNKNPVGSLWGSDLLLLTDVPRGEEEHWISFYRATAQPQHGGTSKASQGFLWVCDSSLGMFQSFLLYPTKCTPSRKTIKGKVMFPDATASVDVNSKGVFFPPYSDTVMCKSVTDITWISLQHSLCQACARGCWLSLLACPRCTGAPPTIWWKGKTSQTPTARSGRNLQGIGNW